MDTVYPNLARAGLDQNYLHANSTTHEFLFGALAELVDNARDAAATKINVFTENNKTTRGGFTLNFLDDGEGMDPSDVSNIVQFGRSSKRALNDNMIGQYGNGLKSGSMRIGSDFILFTKKGRTMTCLMLSRSFYERERIQTIIVPMPSWESDTKRSILNDVGGNERYKTELNLITKYSPFTTEREIMRQFDSIRDKSGTLIVVYNLKLLDSGLPELDVTTDPTDIRMSEMDQEDKTNWPERVSFKAYVSILYLDPRMKVYIQGQKVHTKRLADCLYKPKMYKYSSTRFKKRSEDEVRKSDREYKMAEERAREAESDAKDKEMKITIKANPRKTELVELRKLQDRCQQLRAEANYLKTETERKRASLKEPKTLDFVFGFNIEARKYYGMFIYNCNRLIRMYERVGPQIDSGINCAGIIGVVNIPYLVLEPTHNKQHFADNKEYRHLLKAMGDNLQCYWKDSKVSAGRGIMNFWEGFGYVTSEWDDDPSDEPKYQRARAMHIPRVIQCDACRKWRVMPFQASMIGKNYPDNWICSMNTDIKRKNCLCSEERPTIPLGEFRKEGKTIEQKRMEKEIKLSKIQNEIKKISNVQTVTSSRDAQIKLSRREDSSFLADEDPPSVRTSGRNRGKRSNGVYNRIIASEKDQSSDDEEIAQQSLQPQVSLKRQLAQTSSYGAPKSPKIKTPAFREIQPSSPKKSRINSSEAEEDAPTAKSKNFDTVVGESVEVNISGKWRLGRIVMVKSLKGQTNRWRVKFDQYPQDRFDKWIEEGSPDIRFVEAEEKIPNGVSEKSKHKDKESKKQQQAMDELHENAHSKLRTCLRYFLPPQWKMAKDEINNLTLQELCDFPMDDFFDHYEKGLRKLVSNFRTQADQHKVSADELQNELHTTQQLLYNVLKHIDEDTPDLEGSAVSTYAQEFLENNS